MSSEDVGRTLLFFLTKRRGSSLVSAFIVLSRLCPRRKTNPRRRPEDAPKQTLARPLSEIGANTLRRQDLRAGGAYDCWMPQIAHARRHNSRVAERAA
jgi:hypothetical protein